ncbi:DUF4190 domain-containing protein [Promicromonospora vindobonensis]|uniref:DUF4190 domain-containing protein n=1 Tax=Promicromonospora vindobonensis TaxID=195748 RepID=A0ABW5VMJ0_9MICO
MPQDLRFNVPPGWPAQPEGWRPEPGWQPDPSWPPAPAGWEFWVPASTSNPEPVFALPASPRPGLQPPGMIQVPGAGAPAYPSYQAPPPPGGAYQAVVGPPTPSNPQATASLVLGIVSMFASALFVTAIVGVVLGIVGLARSGRTDPPVGRGKAITGIALSVLSAVLGVFVLSFAMNAMSDIAEEIEEAGAPTVFEDGGSSGGSDGDAPDLADFRKVDAAQWESIAKDPDKAKDRAVIVFAEVAQFDSSTGPDRFRAGAGVDRPGAELELQTNSLFVADEALLDDVVAGDVLKVHAVVTGSMEYETQLGGVATVPVLEIAQLKDVGFADLRKDVTLGTAEWVQADWARLPATVTNSSSHSVTYLVDVVAESKDGSTSYGTGTGLAENLKPGQKKDVVVDFFDEVPADAVFRIESVERFQE